MKKIGVMVDARALIYHLVNQLDTSEAFEVIGSVFIEKLSYDGLPVEHIEAIRLKLYECQREIIKYRGR